MSRGKPGPAAWNAFYWINTGDLFPFSKRVNVTTGSHQGETGRSETGEGDAGRRRDTERRGREKEGETD